MITEKKTELEASSMVSHRHTGIDAPKIYPRDFEGFPVFTAAPTYVGKQGEIVLLDNGTDTRAIYVYLGGVWYSSALT